MGRINYLIQATVGFAALLLLISCQDGSIYESMRNEVANEMAAFKTYYPSEPCIDANNSISIVFSMSMDPNSFTATGSLSSGTVSWSKTSLDNDTVTLTPASSWQADTTLGSSTGSLTFAANSTSGWSSGTKTWTPEIVNNALYVDCSTGNDNDSGSGSAQKPFKTITYALEKAKALYENEACSLYIAQGTYSRATDSSSTNTNGSIFVVQSPLFMYGGYKSGDWSTRDCSIYKTIFEGICTDGITSSTVEFYGSNGSTSSGGGLDGITVTASAKNLYNAICIFTDSSTNDASSVLLNNCTISANATKELYMQCISVEANNTLTMTNCVIDITANKYISNDTSIAIIADGNLFLSSCNIQMTAIANLDNLTAIQCTQNASIQNNTISLNTDNSYTNMSLTGIYVSNTLNDINSIKDNTISIGTIDKQTASSTGIYISKCSSLIVSGNTVLINNNALKSYALYLSGGDNYTVQNNVLCAGDNSPQAISLYLGYSGNSTISFNSLYTGQAASSGTQIKVNLYVTNSTNLTCSANVFLGPDTDSNSVSDAAIYSDTDSTIPSITNNAFLHINDYLVYYSSSVYYKATDNGISSLSNGNIFSNSDITINTAGTYKLQPSASTDSTIIKNSSVNSAPATDILGVARTIPYSIGAYEVD